jgi:TIGR03009 family protein
MIAPVLIAAALSGPIAERIAVERFLGEMGKMRTEVKTLRVTFTLTRTDAVFRKSETFDGTLTVLNHGTVYGALRFEPVARPNEAETWVLRGNDIYHYVEQDKTIRKCDSAKVGALKYIADYWSAAVWLLDAKEARKRCDVGVLKRDEHHSYFTVKVAQPSAGALFFDLPAHSEQREYRLAVTRKTSPSIPAGVVRKVVLPRSNGDTEEYAVTSWARDEHKLTPKHFPDPATPPEGWKVVEPLVLPKP